MACTKVCPSWVYPKAVLLINSSVSSTVKNVNITMIRFINYFNKCPLLLCSTRWAVVSMLKVRLKALLWKLPSNSGESEQSHRLKYVHIELAFCFLVTNYIYPDKIDWLTYHLIAKVAPVFSSWGLIAAVVRYIIYAYSHTCLWHTLDLEESHTHCTIIKIYRSCAFTCAWLNSTTHRHAMIENVYFGAAHYLLPAANLL